MEKFFVDLKNEILRIVGKHDSVSKAETGAELLTAIQTLPSVSNMIAEETEKMKGNIEQDFSTKIEAITKSTNENLSSLKNELSVLKDQYSKMNLEMNKPTVGIQSANVSSTEVKNEKSISEQIAELNDLIIKTTLKK